MRLGLRKAEKLIGGAADGMSPADFDPAALARGTAHELEHTNDRAVAREIAEDHLVEDPDAYPVDGDEDDVAKADPVRKAGPGFSRGPQAGHKYWKRVRRVVNGKATWVYYYANEKDRARWIRRTAKDIERERKNVDEIEEQHKLRPDFRGDHPELMAARKRLNDLSVEYVNELLTWGIPPKMRMTDTAKKEYEEAVIRLYNGGDTEPDELHGAHMSVLRTMELAYGRMPPRIMKHLSGAIGDLVFTAGQDEENLRQLGRNGLGWAGYCQGSRSKASKIVVSMDRSRSGTSWKGMKGGLFPVEVLIHEMGHAVHNRLGRYGEAPDDWPGPNWDDWMAHYKEIAKTEPGVTDYAETNEFERFAESWTAAIMYPRELASRCPRTYEWMRGFLGEDFMRPMRSDPAVMADLEAQKAKAVAARDLKAVEDANRQIDAATGVLDMPKDDRRLEWWKQPETKVQRSLRVMQAAAPRVASFYRNDPVDEDTMGDATHDRFFEVNVGGRTIYFRYGASSSAGPSKGWDPATEEGRTVKPNPAEIKEVYDSDGEPLDVDSAWWYLHQDQLPDDHPEVDAFAGFASDEKKIAENAKKLKARKLSEMLLQMTRASYDPKRPELEAQRPQELTYRDYRQRSGAFTYDRWGAAGQAEIEQLRHEADPAKRAELLAAVAKKQPGMKTTTPRDAKGKFMKPVPLMAAARAGEMPVPQMATIRYLNDNPDGTKTAIEVVQDDSGDSTRNGRYYIDNPLWRELLTPNGEDVRSAQHLEELCHQAALERRRTWVSIRANTRGGDTDHFWHVQVEFDGRGQPKVLGSEWKRRTGKDTPRLDDLLSEAKGYTETARPTVPAEAIKMAKPPKKGQRRAIVGDRTVLRAQPEELRRKEGKEVVVRLTEVVPGKKAGEVPSPPGWDRMPDAPDLPGKGDGALGAKKLTARERQLKRTGLLPSWYVGRDNQREWLRNHYDPAYARWEATKEEETAKAFPDLYVYTGEVGGGAAGKKFVRAGQDQALASTRDPFTAPAPTPLESTPLLYAHTRVHPVDGGVIDREMRLMLPSDGSITADMVDGLPGVKLGEDDETGNQAIRVNMEGFARLRELLGHVSMTADAEDILSKRVEHLRDLVKAQREKKHVFELEDIDPAKLAQQHGVGLKGTLADGTQFLLAHHQKELVQLLVDNDGRCLGGHYMGTGKTISAIVAAKIMLAMRDPEDPSKPHPNAPKRVLIVAPLNTVEQWRQAAETFDEGADMIGSASNAWSAKEYVEALKDGRASNQLAVVGPEYWTLHEATLREHFDGMAMDEAHMGLKNATAERNKALANWNPGLKMLMLLTGTPMTTSPADFMEYIKILSKGEHFAGMTRAQFEEEYLEESPVPSELGVTGAKGPKTHIKPDKLDELSAMVGQWTHIAAPKDVRGKTLPAVRIEESKHAHMTGVQAQLYALRMAALSDADRDRLTSNQVLADDEMGGLDDDARKEVSAAKAIANCAAYKPASSERYVTTYDMVPDRSGKLAKKKVEFVTFDPAWLVSDARGKAKGRWPSIAELGDHRAMVVDYLFKDALLGGKSYAEVENTKIPPEALAKMRDLGWPTKISNPDAGPVGIRCRGYDTPKPADPRLDQATRVQRDYGLTLTKGIPDTSGGGKPRNVKLTPSEALSLVAERHGITVDEAQELLGLRADPTDHHTEVSYGGVTVREGETWYSDTRGSLHLPYRREDWDDEAGRPKVYDMKEAPEGHVVDVPKDKSGATWRYLRALSVADGGGQRVALQDAETGDVKWFPLADVKLRAKSLYDPGMRHERDKMDVAMCIGNAKAEEFMARVARFHQDTGPGPDGERQLVTFGNGILESCRVQEAALRLMGFRDANEKIEGSPHYDPSDPGPSPNGKYFVTYIGSTYTGDRELNVACFQKVKDKLGRDTATSLFVGKCTTGRKWVTKGGDDDHAAVRVSQWTLEQRDRIRAQFGINAPEAYHTGADGVLRYFYGTKESATLLKQLAKAGDPAKMMAAAAAEPDAEKAEGMRVAATAALDKVRKLEAAYEDMVQRGAVTDPPLTPQQTHVFNNIGVIVCSDAAQVGMNLGNASEMIMYDSLSSPMAEWQRITRCARMLPPAVSEELAPIFAKIRAAEPDLFRASGQAGPEGVVYDLEIRTGASSQAQRGPAQKPQTLTSALDQVATRAAALAGAPGMPKGDAEQWGAIAAKARVARRLGTNQAAAALRELAATQAPGGTANVIAFSDVVHPDPEEGTYGQVVTDEATTKLRAAIAGGLLTEEEIAKVAGAGFTAGPQSGSLDPASVYLAMRAQDVLERIDRRRSEVAAEMRSSSAGAVVTDSDVMNAVIDELPAGDRAVLKTKKYLVNVSRIGVSADLPQMVNAPTGETDEEGKAVMSRVHTGYEREAPIRPEQRVRAVGRARMVSHEGVMQRIQDGAQLRTELDYLTAESADVGDASRLDVQKARMRLGVLLG